MAGEGNRANRFMRGDLQSGWRLTQTCNTTSPERVAVCQAAAVGEAYGQAKLWAQKWRWYERNSLPWNRLRIHRELMRRQAFARWPLHGTVLEALREGRLEIGAHTLLEPDVWLTASEEGRIRIGSGTFLNIAVMVASVELVEIGDHC